jgi:hypothetical protein
MHNRFECVKQKGKPHGRKSSGGSIIQHPKVSNYCSSSSDIVNGYMTSDDKKGNIRNQTLAGDLDGSQKISQLH